MAATFPQERPVSRPPGAATWQPPRSAHLAVVDDMDAVATQVSQIPLRIVMQVAACGQPQCPPPATRKVVQHDARYLNKQLCCSEI